jgi:hypothetical protein
MKNKINHLVYLGIFCLSLLAGCTKENNSLAAFQPEITNAPDNFQLQATNVTNVTTTIDYNWSNSGTMATLNKSGVLNSGTAKVSIIDKNGATVLTSDLKVTGDETTTIGATGAWKIRLELSSYNGTLNFRVQKK